MSFLDIAQAFATATTLVLVLVAIRVVEQLRVLEQAEGEQTNQRRRG